MTALLALGGFVVVGLVSYGWVFYLLWRWAVDLDRRQQEFYRRRENNRP